MERTSLELVHFCMAEGYAEFSNISPTDMEAGIMRPNATNIRITPETWVRLGRPHKINVQVTKDQRG